MLIKEETLRNLPFRSVKSCKRTSNSVGRSGYFKATAWESFQNRLSAMDLLAMSAWFEFGTIWISMTNQNHSLPLESIYCLYILEHVSHVNLPTCWLDTCKPTDPPSIVKLGVECGSLPPDQSNSFAIFTAVAKKRIQHTRKSNFDLFGILES